MKAEPEEARGSHASLRGRVVGIYALLIGTSVSAFFLFAIAIANIVILAAIWRTFQKVRRGGAFVAQDLDILLASRGFFGRLFRGLFRLIGRSWHMYPLGLLFGLGFDTA